ncbi:MAG: hypothetical protein ACRDMA_05390 [Solirubrobacterales bacterium]
MPAIDSKHAPDLLAGIAGLVLLISLFLPWFGPSSEAEQVLEEAQRISEQAGGVPPAAIDLTENAWQAFAVVDIVVLLAAVAGILAGVRGLAAAARPRGRAAVGATAVTAALGTIASLLVFYRVLNPIGEAAREYGLYIGLLAAIGVAAGGWLAISDGGGARRAPPRGRGRAPDSVGSRRDG